MAYTLTYRNVGNQDATGVTITETVPANATFNWALRRRAGLARMAQQPAPTCTVSVGNLAAGASGSVTFAVNVVTPFPAGVTEINNTASIADDGANGADPTPANNSATDNTPVDAYSDLSITKTDGGATTTPGGVVTYTLTYQNTGDQNASGVVITETVPANTTFNATASAPPCGPAPMALPPAQPASPPSAR